MTKLRPSQADTWMNCSAYYKYLKKSTGLPDDSVYARQGQEGHKVIEDYFKGDYDSIFDVPTTLDIFDLHTLQKVVEYIEDIAKDKRNIHLEQKTKITEDIKGTADIYIKQGDTLHVLDLKYGAGVFVPIGHQIKQYAIGLEQQLKGVENVYLHILQPRRDSFLVESFTKDEREEYFEYVKKQAKKALDGSDEFNPSYKACRWCQIRGRCGALKNRIDDLIGFKLEEEINMEMITTDQQEAIKENEELIRLFLNAVNQELRYKAGQGELKKYTLESKKGRRTFKPEAEAILKERLGEDAYKKTLIGVTKARSVLSKQEIEELTECKQSEPKLVKVNEPEEIFECEAEN